MAISIVWLFALGGLGLFFPFYSLYLKDNLGLTGSQVGAVLAVLPLVGILVQPIWGQIQDLSGSRARVLIVLALGAGCGYALLSQGTGFVSMLLLTALLAVFSTPLIPTTVAVTFAVTRDLSAHAFGLARMWGTVGFLVAVLSFPLLLDHVEARAGLEPLPGGPSEPALGLMFPLAGAVIATAALFAIRLPRTPGLSLRASRGDWRGLVRHGPYVRLIGFCLLAFLALQGPMAIFPVYVSGHGGSVATVSQLWLPMLLVEIPLIALSGTTLRRFGARGLLAFGVLGGGLRWSICGFLPDSPLVFPAQALHGVVVAGLVIGAPLYVEAAVPERLRSTGQNVLAMLGVSLGGITSNLATGVLLERYGVDAPYQVGGVAALLLGLLTPVLLPRPSRPPEPRAQVEGAPPS